MNADVAVIHAGWGAETLATALEALPDYRVQRRLVPLSQPPQAGSCAWVGCALDVETTGLSCRNHAVVELAIQRFQADADGRILGVGLPQRWLEDPGVPIPPEITALTGITDDAVAGQRINEAVATSMLLDADFVVAHNSAFDRGFVEARLPLAAGRPWICSMKDVDWRSLGFEGRTLSHLLGQIGWFYSAHRADVDVAALLRLLDHRTTDRTETVLSMALATARCPSWIVDAVGAPFEAKERLKARGYRWDALARHWWREVPDDQIEDEDRWCAASIYSGRGSPKLRRIDWTQRYAAN